VVDRLPAVVGRGSDADVWIADQWVSRAHCELYASEGMLAVRDLGSRHGTLVNGQRVADAVLLPGDVLQVGLTRLRVSYRERGSKLFSLARNSAL
jgi:pSer/pThr/pTyr-binding forkhead associated (FHA) protein